MICHREEKMTADERNVDPVQEMLRVIDHFSKIKEWNFNESYRSENEIIYDSKWCRVSIVWGGWDPIGGNSISIHYGRLHAPNEKATMVWEGEDCNAWHGLKPTLYYIDGLSPVEAVNTNSFHKLTDKYHEEEFRKAYHRRQPEWLMKMHMDIWGYYGVRFFELFDLRRPDLWTDYRLFLKEFYDIKGRRKSIIPSLDKVC